MLELWDSRTVLFEEEWYMAISLNTRYVSADNVAQILVNLGYTCFMSSAEETGGVGYFIRPLNPEIVYAQGRLIGTKPTDDFAALQATLQENEILLSVVENDEGKILADPVLDQLQLLGEFICIMDQNLTFFGYYAVPKSMVDMIRVPVE